VQLNETAKAALRDAGVSQAAWARANYMSDGKWTGDACGCPDDRCMNGFHHIGEDDCGCLPVLLEQYLAGEGTFAEGVRDRSDEGSSGA
jgi:hypothetical protein